MTSNRRLDFTQEAEADIREILQYTRETWGVERRRAYAKRLTAAMRELTTYPDLGRSRDDIAPGLRSRPVREHVIYYRVDEQAVTITRVLHKKMDAAGQIKGS